MRKIQLLSVAAIITVFLITALFNAHGAAPAQPSGADIQALRDQISKLEARVLALEQSSRVSAGAVPQLPPGSRATGYGNIQFYLVPTGDTVKGAHPAAK